LRAVRLASIHRQPRITPRDRRRAFRELAPTGGRGWRAAITLNAPQLSALGATAVGFFAGAAIGRTPAGLLVGGILGLALAWRLLADP